MIQVELYDSEGKGLLKKKGEIHKRYKFCEIAWSQAKVNAMLYFYKSFYPTARYCKISVVESDKPERVLGEQKYYCVGDTVGTILKDKDQTKVYGLTVISGVNVFVLEDTDGTIHTTVWGGVHTKKMLQEVDYWTELIEKENGKA